MIRMESTINPTRMGVKQNIVDEVDKGYMPGSEAAAYSIASINDENLRTMWVVENNSDTIRLAMDPGKVMTVNAIQINYLDFNADIYGRKRGLKQQFIIETSENDKTWQKTIDFADNHKDRPHAYIELSEPTQARFIRFRNQYFPNQYLAIGEFRVFGKGGGKAPKTPRNFEVSRQTDQRNTDVRWDGVKDAQGYVLYWGIGEDRLNNSVMIYDENQYALRVLYVGVDYFYRIEAFNEHGSSQKSEIVSDLTGK